MLDKPPENIAINAADPAIQINFDAIHEAFLLG
jgi:hypothetical protein